MVCPNCSKNIPAKAKVCGYCGARLDAPPPPAVARTSTAPSVTPAYPAAQTTVPKVGLPTWLLVAGGGMLMLILVLALILLSRRGVKTPDLPPVEEAQSPMIEQQAPEFEPQPQPPAAPSRTILIYDDDGSIDGTVALLYLLSQPDISIQAIGTSYGEANPNVYAQHMGAMLDQLGIAPIPLGEGPNKALGDGLPFPGFLRQLSDDFWGYPLQATGKKYDTQDAAELIVSTIRQSNGAVTIFISGPFTNLAQALRFEPSIKDMIAGVYFMGGAVNVPGNITDLVSETDNAVAEWNIVADPLAAQEVFQSGLNLFMIPLDATHRVLLETNEIAEWQQGDQIAKLAAEMYILHIKRFNIQPVEIFDLTAAVLLANPGLCDFEPVHAEVITTPGSRMGQTAIYPEQAANMYVCLQPDAALIKQELLQSFTDTRAQSAAAQQEISLQGTWSGKAENDGFVFSISFNLNNCQLNQVCGRFDIPDFGCNGDVTFYKAEQDRYYFKASNVSSGCTGTTYEEWLRVIDANSLEYVSRGDWGESRGILTRQ